MWLITYILLSDYIKCDKSPILSVYIVLSYYIKCDKSPILSVYIVLSDYIKSDKSPKQSVWIALSDYPNDPSWIQLLNKYIMTQGDNMPQYNWHPITQGHIII